MLVNKRLKHFMTTKYNIIKYFYLMLICDHNFNKYNINEHHLKFQHLENMIHKTYKKTFANLEQALNKLILEFSSYQGIFFPLLLNRHPR